MATGDLTTPAQVKGYLPKVEVLDTQFDALLARLITATSDRFKADTNRTILKATVTETTSGSGATRLLLGEYPVVGVTSVTVDGELVPQRAAVGESGWVLMGSCVELVGYVFARGVANVVVVYEAGYTAVPSDVEQAVIKMVALQFADRKRPGESSKAISGESISFNEGGPVLAYWRDVVDAYRRPVFTR